MAFQYNSEDYLFARDTLLSFLKKEIAPVFSTPEQTVSSSVIERLTYSFSELGLALAEESTGLGLWENPTDSDNLKFSLELLINAAKINPGLAWTLHLYSLGLYAKNKFKMVKTGKTVLYLPHGTAKGALAKIIAGKTPQKDELVLIKDLFSAAPFDSRPLFFNAPENWELLIVPVLSDEGGCLNWKQYERKEISAESKTDNHGLNEVPVFEASVSGGVDLLPLERAPGVEFLTEFMSINYLAQTAVALGALQKALEIASEYTSRRGQGGSLLKEYPAIQLMLGNATAVSASVQKQLENPPPIKTSSGFDEAVALRITAHPSIYRAATEMLQTHGGYGYMRDVGLEKILRDCHHLMLIHGTIDDLKLYLAKRGNEQ